MACSPTWTGRSTYCAHEKWRRLCFRETQRKWSHDDPKEKTTKRNVSGTHGYVPGAICGTTPGEKGGVQTKVLLF